MMVLELAGAMRISEQSMERLRLGQVDQVFIDLRGMADGFTAYVIASRMRLAAFPVGAARAISSQVKSKRRTTRKIERMIVVLPVPGPPEMIGGHLNSQAHRVSLFIVQFNGLAGLS